MGKGTKAANKPQNKQPQNAANQAQRTTKEPQQPTIPRKRVRCDCMATTHPLVTNCLGCGRIVCEEEGRGPCMFCGTLVAMTTKEAQAQVREEMRLLNQSNPKVEQSLENAIALKDKMLEFQRNSTQRTAVFDDQADWFASDSNKWLTPEERQMLKDREKEALRRREENQNRSTRKIKLTFDLAGRVVEEENTYNTGEELRDLGQAQQQILDQSRKERESHAAKGIQILKRGESAGTGLFSNSTVDDAPVFVLPNEQQHHQKQQPHQQHQQEQEQDQAKFSRVQHNTMADRVFWGEMAHQIDGVEGLVEGFGDFDFESDSDDVPVNEKDIFEEDTDYNMEKSNMIDKGTCLSMHQPWASLFVYGIKRVEGRTWPTDFRGRLWIASTAKEPTQDEITEMESFYRMMYGKNAPFLSFPKHYPNASLLGCVEVVDCLANDKFKAQFPQHLSEESDSPFVFIGTHRHRMVLPISIQGKHKLWKLEPRVLDAAQTALRSVNRVRVPPSS